MKRQVIVIVALLLVFMTSGLLQAMPRAGSAGPEQIVSGELLVKFAPEAGHEQREAAAKSIGGQLKQRIDGLNVDVVALPRLAAAQGIQSAEEKMGALEHNPLVEYVQPNYSYTIFDATPVKVHLPMVLNGTLFTPNDPWLTMQYAWNSISAYQGWAYDRGSSKVVVAIVDTGIQLDHPDLSGKIVPGANFVSGETSVDDANGHGTHVAGTVGAITHNGIGVAGTCPNCKLMPVRVLGANGSGSTTTVAAGIKYAVDHGAKVINVSLGGPSDSDMILKSQIDYAWSKGAFLACAAGNDGDASFRYPAYYDNCLAVGAVDRNDAHAIYSQYGSWVDIAAPGSGIYSTWIKGSYESVNGTSMATPHVAGVAGILAGQGLTNQQIRDRIESSADAIPGTGTWWSNGRLNLFAAVRRP